MLHRSVVKRTAASRIVRGLRQQVPYTVVVCAFVGSALIAERVLGRPGFLDLRFLSPRLLAGLALYLLFLIVCEAARCIFVERKTLLDVQVWRIFAANNLSLERSLPALVILGLLRPLLSTFASYKALIPELNPFSWDTRFLQADAWLHFGVDPWRRLLPVFGSPAMIDFLDTVYLWWFPVLVMTVVWQAWSGREPLRSQFFLAFALTQILLGVVLAAVLSSAGPCYYADVVGAPSTYDELMLHLATVDATRSVTALDLQEHLWRGYAGLAAYRIEGISAMPSMHVAMSMLLVLLYARICRLAALAAGVFGGLILIGSVMLGWHYAVDGYVGAALVFPLWWIAGRIQMGVGTDGEG